MSVTAAEATATEVTPEDPRYPAVTVGNNARWRATPRVVHLPRTGEEVVAAVQSTIERGHRLSVRSGGHCFEGFVYHDGVDAVIDMSTMRDVAFDPVLDAWSVQAGATLLEVYENLYRRGGVTIPGGVCYSVGAGGHVAGGGYGLLSRALGLTVDHLWGVEVVVVGADGSARLVLATREPGDPHRDLWWAHTGGGGGSFGIVVRYLFRSPAEHGVDDGARLVAPPREVWMQAMALSWDELDHDRFTGLLRAFGTWHERHREPDPRTDGLGGMLMLNHACHGAVGVVTQVDATRPGAEDLLRSYLDALCTDLGLTPRPVEAPVGEIGPAPELLRPQRMSWLSAARLLGTNTPVLTHPALRGKHKSAYLRTAVPDEQLDATYRHLTRPDVDNPNQMLVAMSYGGRIGAVAPDATACAHRGSAYKLLYQGFWTDARDDERNVAWVREHYEEVYAATGGVPVPNGVTDGCYVNYPDVDLGDPARNRSGVGWPQLYFHDNARRLEAVKAAWDPRGTFRHGQSIGSGDTS